MTQTQKREDSWDSERLTNIDLLYSRYEKSFRNIRRNCISLVFFSLIPLQTNVFDWHLTCRLCQCTFRRGSPMLASGLCHQ